MPNSSEVKNQFSFDLAKVTCTYNIDVAFKFKFFKTLNTRQYCNPDREPKKWAEPCKNIC